MTTTWLGSGIRCAASAIGSGFAQGAGGTKRRACWPASACPRSSSFPCTDCLPNHPGALGLQRLGRHWCFGDDAGTGILPGAPSPSHGAEVLQAHDGPAALFDWVVERLAAVRLPALMSSDATARAEPRSAAWAASWGAWAALGALLLADGLHLVKSPSGWRRNRKGLPDPPCRNWRSGQASIGALRLAAGNRAAVHRSGPSRWSRSPPGWGGWRGHWAAAMWRCAWFAGLWRGEADPRGVDVGA